MAALLIPVVCFGQSTGMNPPATFAFSVALALAIQSQAGAVVVASDDFSSGGLSGGVGWLNNWTGTATNPANPVTSNVSPLKAGSGDYLSVVPTSISGPVSHAVSRQFSSSVALAPYTVTFDWRMDTPLTNFTTFDDRVHIGASQGNINSNNTFSWLVGVAAADSSSNFVPDGNWYVYNYTTNDAFSGANLVDTGIKLASLVTYSFVVDVNPGSKNYTVRIVGSDGSSYTSGNLTFRNNSTIAATNTLVFGSVTGGTTDNTTFSIDNVTIDGVPEPGSVMLLGAAAIVGLGRRRRSNG